MSDELKNRIQQDVFSLVEETQYCSMQDKRDAINSLFDKYIVEKNEKIYINEQDFYGIISKAVQKFANETVATLGKRPLSGQEFANLCIIEATLEFLNFKQALRKVVVINKK
jgi:hypothetical protein